ncbi:TIGR02444 family protein [Pseudomonas sp. EggHat1]|uniref:TIGR02444 family protein n=1 Tax=Pseudomonas sp. EggHat1 TaxID=2761624 RepID=UPI0018696CE6|nr:TIGR02444 family protein [Pseudomonas sp. EggHat1]
MQDLWNFALELYARAGVEQACLELQEAGNDVCLLLTGAWLQRRGVRCLDERLQALQALAGPWQREVVTPLRQVRQDWRANAGQDAELAALREQVKKLELQAERILLDRLQALAENWPDEAGDNDWLVRLAEGNSAALQVLRGAVDPP